MNLLPATKVRAITEMIRHYDDVDLYNHLAQLIMGAASQGEDNIFLDYHLSDKAVENLSAMGYLVSREGDDSHHYKTTIWW